MNKKTEQLEPHEQRLKDLGLPTIAETKEYRETVGWVPFEEYMEKIFHHHPGRELDEWNMRSDWLDKQLEPNRLMREAAYLIGLKYRPLDGKWTVDDQKDLEEAMYAKFIMAEFESVEDDINRSPWPIDEGLV